MSREPGYDARQMTHNVLDLVDVAAPLGPLIGTRPERGGAATRLAVNEAVTRGKVAAADRPVRLVKRLHRFRDFARNRRPPSGADPR